MSQWITDCKPCAVDTTGTGYVYNQHGAVTYYTTIENGEAWMPIPRIEPYKKPRRHVVEQISRNYWRVRDIITDVPNNAAFDNEYLAQRLADFFNEVMP